MIKPVNSVSFKAIYQRPGVQYTPSQYIVMNDIVNKLKTPDENGISLEKYYKKKHKDFLITPCDNDSIELSIIQGARSAKTDKAKIKRAGQYDLTHPFQISDIKKENSRGAIETGGIALTLAMFLLASAGLIKSCVSQNCHIQKNENSKIENTIGNIQSTANKTIKVLFGKK